MNAIGEAAGSGDRSAAGTPKIVLHVGEPKTGTTFLQQLMFSNRDELAAQGVLLPGPRPMFHWRATQDLREVEQIPNDPVGPFKGAWDRLAKQALAAERVGVVSHELLAALSERQLARAAQSFASSELHVVFTVRDFATLLTAEWQETVKHRNTRGWEDWLADVIDNESISPDRRQWWFWRVHDTAELARMWAQHVPPERIHVITVPPRSSSQGLLWERFAEVLGIDATSVDLTRARANASLGLPEVELLRRVNEALPADIPNWFYMRHVKDTLAHGSLALRPQQMGRLAMPVERDEWVRKHAEALVSELHTAGYHVIGDLDELLPAEVHGPRPSPRDVSDEQLLGSAVDTIVTLLGELARTKGVVAAPVEPIAGLPVPVAKAHVAKRAAIALSRRYRWVHQVRRGYWVLMNEVRRLRADRSREEPDV